MQKTLIIGDIHGCSAELFDLLDRAAITDSDLVVSVGDMVDRGPDPGGVLDLFQRRPNSVAIMGNHERKHVRGILSSSQEIARAQLGERYDAHVRWMATLPYHWERPDVRVVHFGHYPGAPLRDVPEDVRAGTTSGEKRLRERLGAGEWWERYEDEIPIVFGHRVIGPEPLILHDRVFGIDTGCCHGMRLTGLLLPERKIVSVPARANHWAEVKRQWRGKAAAAKPWEAMSFEQIERRLRALAAEEGEEEAQAIGRWAAEVLAMIPTLRAKLDGELARLEGAHGAELGRHAAQHPAGAWIMRRRAGRLSEGRLGCATPEDVSRLARALGVAVPERAT